MITVIGEILADLIEQTSGQTLAHPGGSPANVAVALARLGMSVNLLSQVGDDAYGHLLLANLRDNGVELAPGFVQDHPRTSTARTSLNQDGQATYTFDIEWRRFAPQAGTWPAPEVTCVHTGSLAATVAPGADDVAAAVEAARRTATVSFDPNCRPSLFGDPAVARERIETLVRVSDIIKASLDDLNWLYPQRAFQDVAREWIEHGAALVVVTKGGDGVWARTRQHDATVPALPVGVVDTVGAGDAFTAGLLYALDRADRLGRSHSASLIDIDNATLVDALMFASRVAALTCARRGADSPTLADLDVA